MTDDAFLSLCLICQPSATYSAWLDAINPVTAIRSWDTVTIVAHGTSGPHHEVERRPRAAAINARKRAIERAAWSDSAGHGIGVQLELIGKSYSESYGFMHASYFTYRVHRTER